MKNFTLLFLLSSLSIQLFGQEKIVLSKGTTIEIASTKEMGSKLNQTGEIAHFEVQKEVLVNGEVIIPAGAKVTGTVTKSKRAKMAGTNAKFELGVDYLELPNGNLIKVSSQRALDNMEDKQPLVIGAAVFINPLFLLFKGKDVTMPVGTIFEVYLDENIVTNE